MHGAPPLRYGHRRCNPLPKAAAVAAGTKEENEVISQSELLRLTRPELLTLLRKIACELPYLPEGSVELRNAHANLLNIRRALARPDFWPR